MAEQFDLNNLLQIDQDHVNKFSPYWENLSIAGPNYHGEFFMENDTNYINIPCISNEEQDISVHNNFAIFTSAKEMGRNEAPITCLICGAPTINYHYDVSSCNSCKTFFRRCVVISKFFKCKYTQNCNLYYQQHPYNPCKGCRLGRCIAIGMNPEAIQFPQDFDIKNCLVKFEEFKAHILPLYLQFEIESPRESLLNEINELLYVENKMKHLRESSYHPRSLLFSTIQEILMTPTELSNAEKYERQQNWPLSMDDIYVQTIEHLKNMVISGELGNNKPVLPIKRLWIATDSVLIIEAAKTLPFFSLLNLEDQTILLRHISLVNANLMECYYSYINNQNTIVMPDGTMPLKFRTEINKLLSKQKGSFFNTKGLPFINQIFQICRMHKANNIIEMIQRFIEHTPIVPVEILEDLYIRILEPLKRINLTEKEYVLLKTLIYCYSALSDLSEYARSILQKQADKYSQLLLRYLQLEHGEIKGAQKYAEVISLMGTFFGIAEKHRQVFFLHRLTRECVRKEIYMNQPPKLVEEIMHVK